MSIWSPRAHPALRSVRRGHALRVIAASVDVRLSATLLTAAVPLAVYVVGLTILGQLLSFGAAALAVAPPAVVCWYLGTRYAVGVFLREQVVDGRFKRCVYCKYDLRGAEGPTCSECGRPVTL